MKEESIQVKITPEGLLEIKESPFNITKVLYSLDGKRLLSVRIITSDYTIREGTLEISDEAFAFTSSLRSIVFPDSLKTIGKEAFICCDGLNSIIASKDLSSIGDGAFSSCHHLKSISFSNSLKTIGNSAFQGCGGLVAIYFHNGLKSIGKHAFWGCKALSKITLPSSLEDLDITAFRGCCSLKRIEILCQEKDSESIILEKFKRFLPQELYNLIEITGIPIKEEKLNDGSNKSNESFDISEEEKSPHKWYGISLKSASNNEESFSKATYQDKLDGIIDEQGNLYSADGKRFLWCKNRDVEKIIIKDGTRVICNSAFYFCRNLVTVYLPDSIEIIGKEAFRECGSLTNINFSSSLKSIGDFAFYQCFKLTQVGTVSNVKFVGESAFCYCYKLKSISFGEALESLGDTAFSGCVDLESITLSPSIKNMGNAVFMDCSALKEIHLPSGPKRVNPNTFSHCKSIVSIYIPEGYESIDENSFLWCSSLSRVVLPNSLKSIKDRAFSGCSALEEINFPNNLKSIGEHAFFYCSKLATIELPSTLESICNETFYGCSCLKSIVFQYGPTAFKDVSLEGCKNLEKIIIRSSSKVAKEDVTSKYGGLLTKQSKAKIEILSSGLASIQRIVNDFILKKVMRFKKKDQETIAQKCSAYNIENIQEEKSQNELYDELKAKKYTEIPFETRDLYEDMSVVFEIIGSYWKQRFLMDHLSKRAYEFMSNEEHLSTIKLDDIKWDNIPLKGLQTAMRLSSHFPMGIGAFKNGVAEVSWTLQPDGRYYMDSDGYGMTDDDEITLYGYIDRTGKVVVKFQIIKDWAELKQMRKLAEERVNKM